MAQSRRTSNPGERLDNAHPRSYLRFASVAYEFFAAAFMPAVVQAAPRLASNPTPSQPIFDAAAGFARALRDRYRIEARKQIIAVCPSLTAEQLGPIAELHACAEERLAAARGDDGMGGERLPPPSVTGDYFANRRTVAMLVGAAWLNMPAELRDAASVRAIAERFEDGIPTGEKIDLHNQVRRGKKLFLERVKQEALREDRRAYDGLPGIYLWPVNLERALHRIWTDSSVKRVAARDGDAVETVRRLAIEGDLYVWLWEALKQPRAHRNRAAIERIIEVRKTIVEAKLSVLRSEISVLEIEQARRAAVAV